MKNNLVISVEVAALGYGSDTRNLRAVVTRGIVVPGGVKFKERFYETSAKRVSQLTAILAMPRSKAEQ